MASANSGSTSPTLTVTVAGGASRANGRLGGLRSAIDSQVRTGHGCFLTCQGGESRAQHLAGCPNDFAQASHPNNRQSGPYGFDLISGLIAISAICQQDDGSMARMQDAGCREQGNAFAYEALHPHPASSILLVVAEIVRKWHNKAVAGFRPDTRYYSRC